MRHPLILAAVAALALAAPASAQSAPVTRDDSLALGRKYVQWIYEDQADSLWARVDERLRGMMGSKEALSRDNVGLIVSFGAETEVVGETVSARDGNLVYTREVRFESRPEESRVWTFVIAPDGTIKEGKFQSKAEADQARQKADSAAARPANQ
jgi:opacity protein-like surface antigen